MIQLSQSPRNGEQVEVGCGGGTVGLATVGPGGNYPERSITYQ
jgi:hypothetical protein